MNENELISKMDQLGQALFDLEQKQKKFDEQNRDLVTKIEDLKDQLKPAFLEMKTGLRSEKLEVVYRKGAVKWDTKWLDGYSLDHPEIARFRKEGQPTIAFKVREEHEDDGR